MRRGRCRDRLARAGFTLVELLVAIAIFAVLSTMLFTLVGTSLSLYRDGERARELYEIGPGVLETLSEDLRGLAPSAVRVTAPPEIRLLVDRDEAGLARLRLVRTLGREASDRVFRLAGTGSRPTDSLDLRDDLASAEDGKLRATGGYMEIAYALRPAPGGDAAILELRRGARAPIGGPGSLFGGIETLEDVDAALFPMVGGVLYFGIECWGAGTAVWDAAPGQGGPDAIWDSTRGELRDSRLFVGETSRLDPMDDVFPRRVRVTLVLERVGDKAGGTFLSEPLPPTSSAMKVDDPRRLPLASDASPFVKIGAEWIRIGSRGSGSEVRLAERGGRGTEASFHAAGSFVHVGIGFQTVVEMPSRREAIGR